MTKKNIRVNSVTQFKYTLFFCPSIKSTFGKTVTVLANKVVVVVVSGSAAELFLRIKGRNNRNELKFFVPLYIYVALRQRSTGKLQSDTTSDAVNSSVYRKEFSIKALCFVQDCSL